MCTCMFLINSDIAAWASKVKPLKVLKYLLGKGIMLWPGSSNDKFTGHIVLGWFTLGLDREIGPSGATKGLMAMEHLTTKGKVERKNNTQK